MPYKPDYWRDPDHKEPTDYAQEPDPNHGGSFEAGRDDLMAMAKRVTNLLKVWLDGETERQLDLMIDPLKIEWLSSGGNQTTWDTIINMMFRESGYAKKMSKVANAAVEPTPLRKPTLKDKPKGKFNGLDLGDVKL